MTARRCERAAARVSRSSSATPALASFFGHGFRDGALPRGTRLEEIPKRDVTSGLGEASRNSRKGEYHKGNHSFTLLGCIDVARLSAASPWARRFFEHMRADE